MRLFAHIMNPASLGQNEVNQQFKVMRSKPSFNSAPYQLILNVLIGQMPSLQPMPCGTERRHVDFGQFPYNRFAERLFIHRLVLGQ